MTEGDPTGRRELLRGMDIFEFHSYLSVHEDIIEKRLRKLEERRSKLKS